MKLTVARSELWRGVDTVLDAVPGKPALPVLSNLLLTADEAGLLIAATDLDLSIRTRVHAQVDEPGTTTIPARTFAEIVREWPDADLALVVSDDRLSLTGTVGTTEASEGAYSLSGMPAADFPAMPDSLDGATLDVTATEGLDAQQLAQMINKTAFAVSRDDTRPVLNGVLWALDAAGIRMVATDGHRFAHYYRQLGLADQVPGEARQAIVPPQTLTQMAKLLGAESEAVTLTLGESQILLDVGHTQLLSRLIEGPYVDYKQVIPQSNDKYLRVGTEQLLPAVRRVSILSSSYTRQVRLRVEASAIELSAASPEIGGEARETIPADFAGDPMDIGYNAQYLMEILRRMDAPEVQFALHNSVTAAVLRPVEQPEGDDYFCLLMPLRPTG